MFAAKVGSHVEDLMYMGWVHFARRSGSGSDAAAAGIIDEYNIEEADGDGDGESFVTACLF